MRLTRALGDEMCQPGSIGRGVLCEYHSVVIYLTVHAVFRFTLARPPVALWHVNIAVTSARAWGWIVSHHI
jgi:hypothetical protein